MVALGIFSSVPPTEPCSLRSIQPLKVSTRDFSWGKGGRCFWLTNYHPCSAETSRKSGTLIYPEPLGPPRPVAFLTGPLSIIRSSILTTQADSQQNLLTPWSRVLLEKLTGSAGSQEIPRYFGTRMFITVLKSARHLSLS